MRRKLITNDQKFGNAISPYLHFVPEFNSLRHWSLDFLIMPRPKLFRAIILSFGVLRMVVNNPEIFINNTFIPKDNFCYFLGVDRAPPKAADNAQPKTTLL